MITLAWKPWLKVLVGLIILEFLSFVCYTHRPFMTPAWSALLIGVFIIGLRRPAWAVYAAIIELAVGSKGYLFFSSIGGQKISLRLGLFAVLVLLAIILGWKKHVRWHWPKPVALPLVLLTVWVVIMSAVGVVRGYGLATVFLDMNAFLYLGSFFTWWVLVRSDSHWREQIIVCILAGVTLVGFKSWLMVLLFGQSLPWITTLYQWIRNTGVGEITLINANLYRVFFQSQVYDVLAIWMVLALFWRQSIKNWLWIPLITSTLGVLISLSRSFWLGAAAGILTMIVLTWRRTPGFRALGSRLGIIVIALGAAWILFNWAIYFPSIRPGHGGGKSNAVIARLNSTGSVQASTARRNQIAPLMTAIKKQPIFGSGFGTPVTYFSTDPRIKGWRTTDAFELGYLDLWLKFGLIGLGLFAWLGWRIVRPLWPGRWSLIFMPGIVVLLVTHVTSPYLNHPLGLGWLILAALYAYHES